MGKIFRQTNSFSSSKNVGFTNFLTNNSLLHKCLWKYIFFSFHTVSWVKRACKSSRSWFFYEKNFRTVEEGLKIQCSIVVALPHFLKGLKKKMDQRTLKLWTRNDGAIFQFYTWPNSFWKIFWTLDLDCFRLQ